MSKSGVFGPRNERLLSEGIVTQSSDPSHVGHSCDGRSGFGTTPPYPPCDCMEVNADMMTGLGLEVAD